MCSRNLPCSTVAGNRLKRAQRAFQASSGLVEAEALRKAKTAFLLTPVGISRVSERDEALAGRLRVERSRRLAQARRLATFHLDISKVDEQWRGDEENRPDTRDPLVAKAYALACSAHAGIRRKSGEAYINHPLRVAKKLADNNHPVATIVVALLHDAVEDSALELSDLRIMGFSEEVVMGVDSVSKRQGEEYSEAVIRAARNPIGRWVKLADNLDNSAKEQLLPFSPEKRLKQKRKYYPARDFLKRVIRATNG